MLELLGVLALAIFVAILVTQPKKPYQRKISPIKVTAPTKESGCSTCSGNCGQCGSSH